MPLELLATEHPVGPFRADLLCQSGSDGSLVVIENQFAKTDHTHLGQIMTYLAGTGASTVVWVAETFTAEHRAALDWLNAHTAVGFNFFGLELELWRIGESLPAPKFNIVSQPNNWAKLSQTSAKEGLSATAQLQLSFWEAFRQYVLAQTQELQPQQPLPVNWYEFSVGRSGFWLGARVNTKANSLWVALFLQSPATKGMFQQLLGRQSDYEEAMGQPLVWKENPQGDRSNVELHRSNSDIREQARWPEYFAWLLENLLRLKATFGPVIPTLKDVVSSEDLPGQV